MKTAVRSAFLLFFALTPIFSHGMQNKPSDETLANLQIAFNGESNANKRYLAFADKAQQEGYGDVASLFRAAARAEQVHAKQLAAEIEKLGAKPEAKIETPAAKSTKENLDAAIQGETYERDTMYPEFRKQARHAYNMDAVRVFNYAYNAESEHAALFMAASTNVEQMRGSGSTYYVCTICGYTMKQSPDRACRSCYSPKEAYEKVS
jgi:rubrerythrin